MTETSRLEEETKVCLETGFDMKPNAFTGIIADVQQCFCSLVVHREAERLSGREREKERGVASPHSFSVRPQGRRHSCPRSWIHLFDTRDRMRSALSQKQTPGAELGSVSSRSSPHLLPTNTGQAACRVL